MEKVFETQGFGDRAGGEELAFFGALTVAAVEGERVIVAGGEGCANALGFR